MKTKQEILVNVISAKLENAKVGVIVRGITEIDRSCFSLGSVCSIHQQGGTHLYC